MNDLISRSALIEEYEWLKSQVNSSSVPEIEEHIERIKKASAVDAVPVVRCKDCRSYVEQYHHVGEETGYVYSDGYCWRWDFEQGSSPNRVYGDDFCSYGERRNGDG